MRKRIILLIQSHSFEVRNYYRPPRKLREANVLSRVCLSVYLSTGGGVPCVTITHDALNLSIQRPLAALVSPSVHRHPQPRPCTEGPQLVTSAGQDWRPVQTCSLEYSQPSSACNICGDTKI